MKHNMYRSRCKDVFSTTELRAQKNVICKPFLLISFPFLMGLVWFYGISTIVGYLLPNPVYMNILDKYDLKTYVNKVK